MSTLGADNPFLGAAAKQITEASVATLALLTTTVLLGVTYAASKLLAEQKVDGVRHIKQVSLYFVNKHESFVLTVLLSTVAFVQHLLSCQNNTGLFIQLSSQEVEEHKSTVNTRHADNCQKLQTVPS